MVRYEWILQQIIANIGASLVQSRGVERSHVRVYYSSGVGDLINQLVVDKRGPVTPWELGRAAVCEHVYAYEIKLSRGTREQVRRTDKNV